MRKVALLTFLLLGLAFGAQAQKLSKDEVAKYENEIKAMVTYLEETMNFLGDSTSTALEMKACQQQLNQYHKFQSRSMRL